MEEKRHKHNTKFMMRMMAFMNSSVGLTVPLPQHASPYGYHYMYNACFACFSSTNFFLKYVHITCMSLSMRKPTIFANFCTLYVYRHAISVNTLTLTMFFCKFCQITTRDSLNTIFGNDGFNSKIFLSIYMVGLSWIVTKYEDKLNHYF